MAKTGNALTPGNVVPSTPKKVKKAPLTTSATKIQSKEMFEKLSGLASGWSEKIATAISPPETLFFSRNEVSGAMLFSSDPDFSIAASVAALSTGSAKAAPKGFGIAVYEKASTSYFILSDSSRRIMVRCVLSNYHDRPIMKEWSEIADSISQAEVAAKNSGKTAIMDGALRLA